MDNYSELTDAQISRATAEISEALDEDVEGDDFLSIARFNELAGHATVLDIIKAVARAIS